jgi:hypothetical protein
MGIRQKLNDQHAKEIARIKEQVKLGGQSVEAALEVLRKSVFLDQDMREKFGELTPAELNVWRMAVQSKPSYAKKLLPTIEAMLEEKQPRKKNKQSKPLAESPNSSSFREWAAQESVEEAKTKDTKKAAHKSLSHGDLTARDFSEFLFVAVHVGGSGHGLSENDVVGFGSDEDGIELVPANSRSRIHLPYGDIIEISVDGGVYQKGGGFAGGGFGLVGFAVGAAASMALNKVTTRTEVETHLRITTNRGEVNLYTNQITSNDLEMSLSEIRTRIRQVNSQGQLQSPAPHIASLSDELLKISELHKSGVLTDEEFQAAKQRLIG